MNDGRTRRGFLATLAAFGRMVRFSHTLFGLPFALAATLMAHRWDLARGHEGLTGMKLVWIVLAFTGARTAAMGFNRIIDRDIDADNPRTATREIPAGIIGMRPATYFTLCAVGLFLASAAALGDVALYASPLCLAVVLGYSYFKRFSWGAHLVLGVALALAPGGAWVAVTGDLAGWNIPIWLMLAVATWVAGFDIIYSLQDEEFDRERGLHSIPVRFGRRGALVLSAVLHIVSVGALLALHFVGGWGWPHLVGIGLIALILLYEHWIVRPNDLSRVDKAFFDLNGYVSIAYLLCTGLDAWLA